MKIVLNNIVKSYKKRMVLNDITLVLDNHIYGLLGPNGSGKSTLIKIIIQQIKMNDGSITYHKDGQDINWQQLNIGYLPQNFGLFKEYTVKEQLEYFCILKNIKKQDRDEQIQKVLEFIHLEDEINTKCGELSGGMVRRVGIAQAFLGQPDFVILDEPTVGLDPYERIRFKEFVRTLDFHIPIILSTHIIEDISSLCSHVIMLKDCQILFQGLKDNFVYPDHMYVYQLTDEQFYQLDKRAFYIKNDEGYRVISSKEYSDFKKVEPTIEDAYLYMHQIRR